MKDVFDKAKSAVKETVDTASEKVKSGEAGNMLKQSVNDANQKIRSGEARSLLTKKNIIIAAVAAVAIIGLGSLIFGGGSENIVGTWETTHRGRLQFGEPPEDGEYTLELSRNGEFVLYRRDGSISQQGRWITGTKYDPFTGEDVMGITYYERYVPGNYFQPNTDSGGFYHFSDNLLILPSPTDGGLQRAWQRVR